MEKFLAESTNYKLYSCDENTYLKDKRISNLDSYDKVDVYIDSFYGEPNAGHISPLENYLVIGGNNLTIYMIDTKELLYPEKFKNKWILSFFQKMYDDDAWDAMYFVAYNDDDRFAVFRLNINDINAIEEMN